MAATITVNSTNDSNTRNAVLTLREAILIANGTLNLPTLTAAEQAQINGTVGTGADRDTIAFNIGAIGSQQLIQPLSALPQISDNIVEIPNVARYYAKIPKACIYLFINLPSV
jgi:hypothetical protein